VSDTALALVTMVTTPSTPTRSSTIATITSIKVKPRSLFSLRSRFSTERILAEAVQRTWEPAPAPCPALIVRPAQVINVVSADFSLF
jgi:hypothetical protein